MSDVPLPLLTWSPLFHRCAAPRPRECCIINLAEANAPDCSDAATPFHGTFEDYKKRLRAAAAKEKGPARM